MAEVTHEMVEEAARAFRVQCTSGSPVPWAEEREQSRGRWRRWARVTLIALVDVDDPDRHENAAKTLFRQFRLPGDGAQSMGQWEAQPEPVQARFRGYVSTVAGAVGL